MAAIPQWALDLQNLHAGRVARQFILHFNITDHIIDMEREIYDESTPPRRVRLGNPVGEPIPFRTYLHKFLRERVNCQAMYSYSLAGGLIADEDRDQGVGLLQREMKGEGWDRLFATLRLARPAGRAGQNGQTSVGREVNDPDLPDDPVEIFRLLGHLLRQRHAAPGVKGPPTTPQEERPIAVIIDYAEKLMPVGVAEGHSVVEQLVAVEVAQRWAVDPLIRLSKNIIILLTTNIGQLAQNIPSHGSGTRTIRVPLPDEHERRAYIQYLMALRQQPGKTGLAPLQESDFDTEPVKQVTKLTGMTQGMRLIDIDNLNRALIMRARNEQKPPVITQGEVQHEKEEVIQSQSEHLLEIVQRDRGFEEIGGLEPLKKYLTRRAGLMLQGSRSPLVPMGLLLAGPPGTGKTIIAEALAKESGFNLVKMRNIQDRWVGSSERNLDMVLNLLKDLYPVVVFIDEIDQAVGRRDTGNSGDSGVSGRMFARILEEMSDPTNRGRILWVAATNRTDILDSALLRRFDRVIPLLVPDEREASLIYITMPRTINKQSGAFSRGGSGLVQYGGDLTLSDEKPPTPRDLACFADIAQRTTERGLTGAGIEIVVRRAFELAEEELLDQKGSLDERDAPVIESHHLHQALDDYKPNHQRDDYDFQSLLAIHACNFLSVLPPLPARPPFTDLFEEEPRSGDAPPGRQGQSPRRRISPEKLNTAIRNVYQKLSLERR